MPVALYSFMLTNPYDSLVSKIFQTMAVEYFLFISDDKCRLVVRILVIVLLLFLFR